MRSRAFIFVLPGGAYFSHASHEAEPIVNWLVRLGIEARILHYPVAPSLHPESLAYVQEQIRMARAEFDGPIGVLGFSAGGHLAGLAALTTGPGQPDFAVLCYPVVSMIHEAHEASRDNFLGPSSAEEQKRMVSLENLVVPGTVPIFLWHTADDSGVRVTHSYRLGAALAQAAVPHELHIFPHGEHGLGLASDQSLSAGQWTHLCERWLRDVTNHWHAPEPNEST